MNEAAGKTGSCLAIAEKRPHRPGGCVGIFFQLFDWNRRLAKKKLFSRKLLPPARGKQTTKKYGGDDKMPKTKPRLIADENSGGFPNVKKNGNRCDVTEQKHEMRAAGLVARLMGLESMPAVHRDKHKKASNSATCEVKKENFVDAQCGSDVEVLKLDKGSSKVESRPQKLQKTGQFERRAVTRFGAEALHIRNVLSRSRKHQHPKLASPVKSPRISSSRNVSRASRLIDAATRILEPGLQATNRAKCALTYSGSIHCAPKNEILMEAMGLGVMSPDLLLKQQQNEVKYDVAAGKSLMGQASCKNCGNLLDVVDSRPTVEEQRFVCSSSAANAATTYLQELVRIKPRPLISSPEQERNETYQQNQVKLSTAAERLDNSRACGEPILDRKPAYTEGQVPRQFRSQHCRSPKDETHSIASRQRTETRNEMSVCRNRIPPRAKLNDLQSRRASSAANAIVAKDFVAMNRSLGGRTRPRVSTKADNYMVDTERKVCSRRDDSLPQLRPPVRKRRTASSNAQLESNGLVSSTSMRHRNIKCDLMIRKELEPDGNKNNNVISLNHASIKTRSASQGNKANGNKNNDVISFTFNSPLKHKSPMSSKLKESMDHINNASHEKKLLSERNDVKTFSQRKIPLDGDTLGALLEQKLKELTSQEEDELAIGGSAPKRSTAMILQELISALVEQQPLSPVGHMSNAESAFQTRQGRGGTSVGFSHDSDHLSPGSVLEASFSNESCFSSSVDDNSGRRLFYDSVDYSCDQLQPIETDAELQDSATSGNEGRMGSIMVTDLLNHLSVILQSINLADGGLTGARLTYVREVILNAELLFGSAAPQNSDRMKSSFIGPFLLNELETLAGTMWTNFNCLSGFEESKEGSEVRRFLFDSVIECLDSKYSRYCNSGYKAWRRVPSCMKAEILIEEVGKEIRRWTDMAGMIPDEIIEWEMSHALGKWTDFEIETFETGADIDWDILQVLVDEIVIDFWNCRINSL
ncbi:uncharacterized protein LOC8269347 [Ricinus communis]|uniref:uncharacterized protein LOC8269347 n=1 Tax=Ricinus communis TaxID=3988 RepID=UPI00201AD3D5|nr:uncharacterized protein LOC8269347 [Ricinus communis]